MEDKQEKIKDILFQELTLFSSFQEGLYKHLAKSDLWIQQAIQILNTEEIYKQMLISN